MRIHVKDEIRHVPDGHPAAVLVAGKFQVIPQSQLKPGDLLLVAAEGYPPGWRYRDDCLAKLTSRIMPVKKIEVTNFASEPAGRKKGDT